MAPLLTISRMSFGAAYVACTTYGLYVLLAGICLYFLLGPGKKSGRPHAVLIAYTTVMFVTTTIYFVAGAKWSEIEFVESTGNSGSFAVQMSNRLAIVKNSAIVVNIWLADSLIIYHTYIVWGSSVWVICAPILLYLANVAFGIALLIATAQPGTQYGGAEVVAFGTTFWSLSVALNVTSTLLIAGRLMYQHHLMRNLLGNRNDHYISVVALLAESAAVYSISGLIYIPLYAKDLPLQYPFSALFCATSSIAPNLIVLRMALGVAVNKRSFTVNMSSGVPAFGSAPRLRPVQSDLVKLGAQNASCIDSTIVASATTSMPSRSYPSLTKTTSTDAEVYGLTTFKEEHNLFAPN